MSYSVSTFLFFGAHVSDEQYEELDSDRELHKRGLEAFSVGCAFTGDGRECFLVIQPLRISDGDEVSNWCVDVETAQRSMLYELARNTFQTREMALRDELKRLGITEEPKWYIGSYGG